MNIVKRLSGGAPRAADPSAPDRDARRSCLDGVFVGDEVYGTRHLERDILWFIGTVTRIESTDLIEVRWHSQALDPFAGPRLTIGKPHRQIHDRAGIAHTACRGGPPEPLGAEYQRPR